MQNILADLKTLGVTYGSTQHTHTHSKHTQRTRRHAQTHAHTHGHIEVVAAANFTAALINTIDFIVNKVQTTPNLMPLFLSNLGFCRYKFLKYVFTPTSLPKHACAPTVAVLIVAPFYATREQPGPTSHQALLSSVLLSSGFGVLRGFLFFHRQFYKNLKFEFGWDP